MIHFPELVAGLQNLIVQPKPPRRHSIAPEEEERGETARVTVWNHRVCDTAMTQMDGMSA